MTDVHQPTVLTFAEVVARRARRLLLDHVSFEIPGGKVTVIAGPSGAGKTSLLRLCNRLDVPDAGRILYRGQDISARDPLELRRRIGMVFQRPVMFPGTVRDNFAVADPGATRERCVSVLDQVSLDANFVDRDANTLSGGEAQRVCLARTLLTAPDVLLADEPTSALDLTSRLAYERMTCELAGDGLTVLWVTHDLEQLRRLADHVLILLEGRIRFAGPPADLEKSPGLGTFLSGGANGTG